MHENDDAAAVPDDGTWKLRLYVAGQTQNCLLAFANLKRLCEEHLAGRYQIEVVDLLQNPRLAAGDQILAVPTLVRRLPPPFKKIVGNLADREKVLVGLDLRPSSPVESHAPPPPREFDHDG